MIKKKICFVITTRGNYAKLKPIIKATTDRNDLEVQVIAAGGILLAKYGNIGDDIAKEFHLDRRIPFIIEGENLLAMAKSAGIGLSEFATAFENLKPDIVVIVGDRYETLAIAMAAAYMNISIAHLEGGEVSGSIDESIRHAITKLSHLHFPCCPEASKRIIKLGEADETVYTVGATSLDSMVELDLEDKRGLIQAQTTKGVGPPVDISNGYLLVLFHPVTTEYSENEDNIEELILSVDELKQPTLWLWPNMDAGSDIVSKKIRIYREHRAPDHIHFFKGLPIELFGPALYNTRCIIGNSSCGIRESAYFGVPSVTIGSRQNGRDRGRNVISVPAEHRAIISAVQNQLKNGRFKEDHIYGDGRAASKIAHVLATTQIQIQKRITY